MLSFSLSSYPIRTIRLLVQVLTILRRTSRENKIDLVIKILLDQGGDLDFIWVPTERVIEGERDRGKDGLAMMHRAADSGNGEFLYKMRSIMMMVVIIIILISMVMTTACQRFMVFSFPSTAVKAVTESLTQTSLSSVQKVHYCHKTY